MDWFSHKYFIHVVTFDLKVNLGSTNPPAINDELFKNDLLPNIPLN